jgi:hypothetical protein
MSYEYYFEESASTAPILLFLDGVGESGGNLEAQVTSHGPWSKGKHVANQHVHDALSRFFRVAPHLMELAAVVGLL